MDVYYLYKSMYIKYWSYYLFIFKYITKNLIIYQICENKMGLNLIKLILHSKPDLAIVAKI